MLSALAIALLLQDSPTEFFQKVEKKIAEAGSLSADATIEVEGRKGGVATRTSFTARVVTKGEGKAMLTLDTTREEKPVNVIKLVGDGGRVRFTAGGQSGTSDCTLPLGALARRLAVRAGLFGPVSVLYRAVQAPKDSGVEHLFPVKEVSDGGEEKAGGRTLRILDLVIGAPAEGDPPIKSRVWIDTETLLPAKRVTVSTNPKDPGTITEVYSAVRLDAEIPDDSFKIDK